MGSFNSDCIIDQEKKGKDIIYHIGNLWKETGEQRGFKQQPSQTVV